MSGLAMKHIIAVIGAEVDNARHIIRLTPANEAETAARLAACQNIAEAFADRLAKEKPIYTVNGNRRFDRQWFLTMCGLRG